MARAAWTPTARGGSRGESTLSVAQALALAHATVEGVGSLWIEGEISGWKLAASGHGFFSLREGDAALGCAMWRSTLRTVRVRMADGVRVRALGRFGVYAGQGRLQFYVERVEETGAGALAARLEALKAKLHAEGLFAVERKRALPRWPRVVGIVTSREGAAIHDVIRVLARRCPVRLLLAPSAVQGPNAASELVAALQRIQQVDEVEVVIVGRGGGSAEDLWAFHDEALARAIAACRVPVISAVGHEIDTSVSDLVADRRAATPSHAAQLVIGERRVALAEIAALTRRLASSITREVLGLRRRTDESSRRLEAAGRGLAASLQARLDSQQRRAHAATRRALADARQRLAALRSRIDAADPRRQLRQGRARLDLAWGELSRAFERRRRAAQVRLATSSGKLVAMSPLAVLERGYALVTTHDGQVVRAPTSLTRGQPLAVRVAHGRFSVTVEELHGEDAPGGGTSDTGGGGDRGSRSAGRTRSR